MDTISVDCWDSLFVHNLLGLTTLTVMLRPGTGVTGAASWWPYRPGPPPVPPETGIKQRIRRSEAEGFSELFLSRLYFRNQILKPLFNNNPMSEGFFFQKLISPQKCI